MARVTDDPSAGAAPPGPGEQWIVIHREAPPKPALGAPCNGCGLCCAFELCPPARLRFLRLWRGRGPCPVLRWQSPRYVCGLFYAEASLIGRWGWLKRLWNRLIRRQIGAGVGCDAELSEVRSEASGEQRGVAGGGVRGEELSPRRD